MIRKKIATRGTRGTPGLLRPGAGCFSPAENLPRTASTGGDAGDDPLAKRTRLEVRGDHIADDSPGEKVGQPAFQPVADLDSDLAVGFGDQQDGAIVRFLLADLPVLGNPDGEIRQRIALEGRNGQSTIWVDSFCSKSVSSASICRWLAGLSMPA